MQINWKYSCDSDEIALGDDDENFSATPVNLECNIFAELLNYLNFIFAEREKQQPTKVKTFHSRAKQPHHFDAHASF